MKLVDLDPKFFDHREELASDYHGRECADGTIQWGGFPVDALHHQDALVGADGIRFECPGCRSAERDIHMVQVFFGHGNAPAHLGKNGKGETQRWSATGTGYADLALSPSIQVQGPCNWHGFVRNGEIVHA